MPEDLKNKAISTPLALAIILVVAVLAGGYVLWQCSEFQKEKISIPLIKIQKKEKLPDKITDWRKCSTDSDCIIVKGDCCGCGMGGTATTINKKFKKEWEDKLSKECKETVCLAVISDHPSCFKKPKCINNVCELK
jgi:hypothetical protein